MTAPHALPTPSGGHRLLGQTVPFLCDPLHAIQRWGQTDEPLLEVTVAGRRFCLVSDPDTIGQVLATDADHYRKAEIVRENLGRLQGGSLVLLDGDQWRERRALLQPAFGGAQVRKTGSLTTQYARAAVEGWPTRIRADEEMRSLSLGILARALFGLDLEGGETPIHEAADDVLAGMDPRTLSAFLPAWVPTPTNYRYRQAVATLHDRIDALVEEEGVETPGDNLLSIMLAAGLDPETVRNELISLLFAGYDSTATALALTLGLLADHPEVQARLRAELARTLDGATPTPADIEEVPLLDAVVRESLRLYPPQYLLFREPTRAVTLAGYHIDEGTTVVLSPWACQRDPRYWTAPEQFRPERWRGETDHPEFAYVPYGTGPRYCLGRGLADQTIRLVVAVVCQRRQLQLQGDRSVTAGPTLSPGTIELRTFPDA